MQQVCSWDTVQASPYRCEVQMEFSRRTELPQYLLLWPENGWNQHTLDVLRRTLGLPSGSILVNWVYASSPRSKTSPAERKFDYFQPVRITLSCPATQSANTVRQQTSNLVCPFGNLSIWSRSIRRNIGTEPIILSMLLITTLSTDITKVAHGILDAWSGSTDVEARRERGRRGW